MFLGGTFMWFICYPDISLVEHLPFYTISVGMHLWQYPTPRENGYPYPQFLYSNKGKGKLITEGKTWMIPEHSIVFLPANVPHYYEAVTKDIWDVRWFVPFGDGTLALLKEFGFDRCRIFPITNLGALDEIHNKIHMAFQINTKESIFFSASYTYEFIFEFYRQYKKHSSPKSAQYRRRLTPLIEYIEHHFASEITQSMLCEQLHVSPQHLCRMFRECLNTRPMAFITQVRLRHACELLAYSSLTVSEICEHVGFHNLNYFCKEFKRYTGSTPTSYRNTTRES